MNLLDRMKGKTRGKTDGSTATLDDVEEFGEPNPAEATIRLGPGTLPAHEPTHADSDSSIISEAAPSELAAEYSETRLPGDGGDMAGGAGSGVPVIGHWPAARQQRTLLAVFAIGLAGLAITGVSSVVSSNRSAAQVGAAGQAQTQSQRLAKSVSQALVGSQQAFAEVKESVEVLARNVRGLKNGDSDVPAAPGALQDQVDKLVPMVDRAEKNSGVVTMIGGRRNHDSAVTGPEGT